MSTSDCQTYDCFVAGQLTVLSDGAVAGIMIGTVGGLALFGLVAFWLIRRNQEQKRRLQFRNEFNKNQFHNVEAVMLRNVYPIDDRDYMEALPDIHINLNAEYVKDHVFKITSLEKQFVRVIHPLKSPENPDEIELLKNDIIRMYYYFDDGWAFGDNFGSNLRGLFPLLCVVNLTPEEVYELLYLQDQTNDYDRSIRHFSTGVQFDLDPKATMRLQHLRRSLEDPSTHVYTPPTRTASMHATFSPHPSKVEDMQDEGCFRSDSSGSTPIPQYPP